MIFSSLIFIFYFLPIVLGLYYVSSFSRKLQNIILLISSLIFYAFGKPEYVLILIASICVNYTFGILIEKFRKHDKIILIITLILNLGMLFAFKYLNFSFTIINDLLGSNIEGLNIIAPIGISFYTLKAVGYIVDVYKGEIKARRNFVSLGLHLAYFPTIIVGPIMDYSDMEDQILNRKENFKLFSNGVCRFIVGLSKVTIIAASMGMVANKAFFINEYDGGLPVTLAWLGAIAFSFEIYYDFSGYSDMAIGLGQMFGFKINENFNYPYISKSIAEFSRRWHISLINWFKKYVYFPLGGSRIKNEDKVVRNIFVVWILSGIWHGADWTFIIWSLFCFLLVLMEKVIGFESINIKSIYKHIYTLFFINLGWVLFRAGNLINAGDYISSMFGFNHNGFLSEDAAMLLRRNLVVFIIAIVFSMPITRKINFSLVHEKRYTKVFNILYPIVFIILFVICISYITARHGTDFIYFKF